MTQEDPRYRLISLQNGLCQWPEFRCAHCGQWKPKGLFELTRQGKVSAHCSRCLKTTRKRRK